MKARNFLSIAGLLLFVTMTACMKSQFMHEVNPQQVSSLDSPLDLYTLSWADEFTDTVLDTTQWKYRVGISQQSLQRVENVIPEDGKLRINLERVRETGQLTGGGIITKTPWRYGYYEVKVKMDGGQGWHEAFWTAGLCGFDDPNPTYDETTGQLEMDCFEHYAAYDEHTFTYGAIEWQPLQGGLNRDYDTVAENLAESYNTFGFEYTPDYLNYYYNGTLLKTVDMRVAPKHDFYLWLSCIATEADATDSGAVFFDYLRCYEITPANYALRKVPFIEYLDSLRGPQQSNGVDLWIEAEDFALINNWTKERDVDQAAVLRGFTQYDASRDSAALKARTVITVDSTASYTLWVRARDFSTAPGIRKFKVLINGQEAVGEFGTHGSEGYAWQNGGTFLLAAGTNLVELFDSSQYFARCDRLLLTTDTAFVPSGIGAISNVVHSVP